MKILSNLLTLVALSLAFDTTKCNDFDDQDGSDTNRDLRKRHNDGSHDWGHHHHGDGFNKTQYLLEKCANASIVCEDVPAEDLAECSNITTCGHHGFHRNLAFTFEKEEDGEFYDFLEGVDLVVDAVIEGEVNEDISEQPGDLEKRELRGGRNRRHGKGGKWGAHDGKGQCSGLNETEIEAIKMKRLVCKCCEVDE